MVTQALLLRESLVLLYGSELAWGVMLFAWLLGVAGGAALGGVLAGRAARRGADAALAAVLLALSAAACAELWVFRGARAWLEVGPGEMLPLSKTALAAVVFITPASALIGMAFPLACAIGAANARPCLSFAHVYALESAGGLVGGAAFSFWAVEHLAPLQTALASGALTAAASAGLLLARRANVSHAAPFRREIPGGHAARRRRVAWLPVGLGIVAAGAALVAAGAGNTLNRRLVERRWRNLAPGYELVAETESKYQNLAIGARAGQFTLYCDGHVTTDFPDPYTFVPLAHFWLCQHPAPRHVLVLGGGAEGLLSEILRHPVERVDYVEPDPRLIELVKPYLTAPDEAALRDPRVHVHAVDGRHFIKTQRDRFDLVIARLPEPTSALRARFYTAEFYAELRRAMTPRSVLCLTATAAPAELSSATQEYLASIRATLRRHFPHVVVGWGDPAQVLAATAPDLVSTDPAELTARYTQRRVESEGFDPAWFAGATDWLSPEKLAWRASELDEVRGAVVSTDLRPVIYVQRLALWEAAVGTSRIIAWLRTVSLTKVVAATAVLSAVILLSGRVRRGPHHGWSAGALSLSVTTTGFATMALSLVWLFAFQNLYGYVYQRVGWIVALFMGGLVVGCLLGGSGPRVGADVLREKRVWRRLVLVDVLLAVLAASGPVVLPALAVLQAHPRALVLVEGCISLLVVVTGVLGGATFALAGRLQLRFSGRPGAAAGAVVSADHIGACLGALLCGVILVPVFGTVATAVLLAGIKLATAGLLTALRPPAHPPAERG